MLAENIDVAELPNKDGKGKQLHPASCLFQTPADLVGFLRLGDALKIVRGPPKPDPNSPDLEPLEPFVAAACANASQAYGPV